MVIGWILTSKILEKLARFITDWKLISPKVSLKFAVNVISIIALIYLILVPTLFIDLFIEGIRFTTLGFLGLIFFYMFKWKNITVMNEKFDRKK